MAVTLFDDLQALLAVQAVDARIGRAQATQRALDTGAALSEEYGRVKAEAEALRSAAGKAQATQRDAELHLQSLEAKAADIQKKLFSGKVTASKELENLQKEVEMLGRQRNEAETQVLEAMEPAGSQTAAANEAQAGLARLADRYRQVRVAYKERDAALAAEIAAAEKERARAAKQVSPAVLARYDAIRGKKNGVGAAALSPDGTCGACHTRIGSGLAVAAAASVELCEYCGRILVPAPPTEPPS